MTVKEIYNLAIQFGIKNDLRSPKEVREYLAREKNKYNKLPKEEQVYYDKERLTNPYSDTRVHFDGGARDIKKVLAGVDVSMGAIMLAKELDVDLVICHHPVGLALTGLDDVMNLQIDLMEKIGIPVAIAEKLIHKRINEVARGISPVNHYAVTDAAKLMKINLINVHTPADNAVFQFVSRAITKVKPRYVEDILKALLEIPEYQKAKKLGSGPILFSGSKDNRCGRVEVTEMTGGTDGSKEIYQVMANAGIGTVVSMHQSEEHREAAEKAHINVIVAGHISSDSIGVNLFLDELEKRDVEIIPFSGLIRISRVGK